MPANIVIHFAKSVIYTVYRRIVNTPATAKLALEEGNKVAQRFAFFPASQKTLKNYLIR